MDVGRLLRRGGTPRHFRTATREVFDVSGAGDTVLVHSGFHARSGFTGSAGDVVDLDAEVAGGGRGGPPPSGARRRSRAASGRARVIAGIGYRLEEAVALGRACVEAGADGYETAMTLRQERIQLESEQSEGATQEGPAESAQVTGLEWNVRVSEARNPAVVAKFAARELVLDEGFDELARQTAVRADTAELPVLKLGQTGAVGPDP